jgi:hypothetical protein
LASLRAKGTLHPSRTELFNKVLSLSGFLVLLIGGWIALCYIRATLERRSASLTRPVEAAMGNVATQPRSEQPINLVYAAQADQRYYHRPNHVPGQGDRNALSEDAARRLGLRPCPICMRGQIVPQSPAKTDRLGASESPK